MRTPCKLSFCCLFCHKSDVLIARLDMYRFVCVYTLSPEVVTPTKISIPNRTDRQSTGPTHRVRERTHNWLSIWYCQWVHRMTHNPTHTISCNNYFWWGGDTRIRKRSQGTDAWQYNRISKFWASLCIWRADGLLRRVEYEHPICQLISIKYKSSGSRSRSTYAAESSCIRTRRKISTYCSRAAPVLLLA